MIETEQTIAIAAPIDAVWDYVRDVARWAALMPGYRECEIVDDDHSRWTLKVGVGALVRTVRVAVSVDRWDGPESVAFSYALDGDPVEGDGTYAARAAADGGTEVTLTVRVRGSGSMAPMWEAMGRPVLPKLARSFANQLKERIEEASAPAPEPETTAPMPPGRLRRLFGGTGTSEG